MYILTAAESLDTHSIETLAYACYCVVAVRGYSRVKMLRLKFRHRAAARLWFRRTPVDAALTQNNPHAAHVCGAASC